MLTNVKDPTPLMAQCNVVYRIPCKTCEKSYIGLTKRSLECRLKKHRRATFSGNRDVSAVAEHVMDTGHDIDWDGAQVLDSCGLHTPEIAFGVMVCTV